MINVITLAGKVTVLAKKSISKADGSQQTIAEGLFEFAYYDREPLLGLIQVTAYGKAVEALTEGGYFILEGQLRQQPAPEGSKIKPTVLNVGLAHPATADCQLNSVTLLGRLGTDPEIRYFESGATVVSFTVAVDSYVKDAPDWFNIKIWEKAEVVANYTHKGDRFGVTGPLTMEKWTKDGAENSKFVVRGKQFQLPAKSEQAAKPAQVDDEF